MSRAQGFEQTWRGTSEVEPGLVETSSGVLGFGDSYALSPRASTLNPFTVPPQPIHCSSLNPTTALSLLNPLLAQPASKDPSNRMQAASSLGL